VNEEDLQRLSRITTLWTVVLKAHRGHGHTVTAAQELLLQRYAGAVYRYLLAAVRDVHVAEELAQEFALHFLQGKFHAAHPERGRFRDYVKTAVLNLVRKHRHKAARRPANLAPELEVPDASSDADEADRCFAASWRDELLARTWEALARSDRDSGQLLHAMLWYRTQHPDVSSAQMAEELGPALGKKLTAAGVRQAIHRARARFADLLFQEVGRSLPSDDLDHVEQELADLGLLCYCRDELAQRRKG
jgi:DNA-directed RNA polymerase specialized sigma24 family protein